MMVRSEHERTEYVEKVRSRTRSGHECFRSLVGHLKDPDLFAGPFVERVESMIVRVEDAFGGLAQVGDDREAMLTVRSEAMQAVAALKAQLDGLEPFDDLPCS